MNPRDVRRMMNQMGIKSTEMPDVKEVILKGRDKDYVIENASVTMIEAQGQKTFQVMGTFKEKAKVQQEEEFNDEDIKLVMEQCNVSREKAMEALKKAGGEPAQAILDLGN
ncbi:MAG: nascent polypeptide-associated complex protein [Ferroplasma sp.]|uniref:nascent polypeptide-associated complex protein n=1 Tax=Ferroplasma sp. TaxID=2591003 RepID=UPI002814AF7C|nr:nascent polypeptide-associated complex protein [Ferroplasma sp.]WMT51573.1 MAG: nascent polypeptide-associated complex protein [Ferroplasma sp.]